MAMCVILWNNLLIAVEETMPFLEERTVHVVVDHLALCGYSLVFSTAAIILGALLKNVGEVSHELMEGN